MDTFHVHTGKKKGARGAHSSAGLPAYSASSQLILKSLRLSKRHITLYPIRAVRLLLNYGRWQFEFGVCLTSSGSDHFEEFNTGAEIAADTYAHNVSELWSSEIPIDVKGTG